MDEASPDSSTSGFRKALEWCWLAVIFLIPVFFSPFSHQLFNKALLLQVLVITMLALWLADWLANRPGYPPLAWRHLARLPLHLSIFAFGLMTIIATIASITPQVSFWGSYNGQSGLINLLCWILFFLIIAHQLRRRSQLVRAVSTLLLSSAVVSIVGIAQHYLPGMSSLFHWPTVSRVFSTIGNPLSLSFFLSMVVPFTIAVLVYSRQGREGKGKRRDPRLPAALVTLLVLQFWCLFLAQYSFTLLAYLISAAVFITLLGIIERKRLLLGIGFGGLAALAVMAVLIVVPVLFPAAGGGATETGGTTADELGLTTIKYRAEYWRAALSIVGDPPLIPFTDDSLHSLRTFIGYGPETFIITSQGFSFTETSRSFSGIPFLLAWPHNHYLYLATTTGVLGLAAFIAIIAVFFRHLFRCLRRVTLSIDKLLIIALIAGMAQYLVDSLFNPAILPAELVFWLMLGMVPVLARLTGKDAGAEAEAGLLREHAGENVKPPDADGKRRNYLAIGCASLLIILAVSITVKPFLADIEFQKALNFERTHSEQAIFAFNRTTRMAPDNPVYWAAMSGYIFNTARKAASETVRTRLLAFATDTQEKALVLEPYIAFRNYSLADMYLYRTINGAPDQWKRTLELYDRASRLAPANPAILNRWALALIIKGDFAEARAKLEHSASLDPGWVETSFLSGLLLAEEGRDTPALDKLTAPLEDDPDYLTGFATLCSRLALYDIVYPIDNALSGGCAETSPDWTPCAMAGVTAFFSGDLAGSIDSLDRAMALAPDSAAGEIFRVSLDLAGQSPDFKTRLAQAAPAWREKLSRNPQADRWLKELDELEKTGLPEPG